MVGFPDLLGYCSCSCANCGSAFGELPGNVVETFKCLLSFNWCKTEGKREFAQYPSWACWYNCPLCLAMCFLAPCCLPVVHFRNMERLTGKSCESEAITCCVLSLCCCMNNCYYAKARSSLRAKYGIKSSEFCDCFCCFWSPLCTVCQDANELQNVTDYKIPFCSRRTAEVIRNVTHTDALTDKAVELEEKINTTVKNVVSSKK